MLARIICQGKQLKHINRYFVYSSVYSISDSDSLFYQNYGHNGDS